jgi:hypothetical protein
LDVDRNFVDCWVWLSVNNGHTWLNDRFVQCSSSGALRRCSHDSFEGEVLINKSRLLLIILWKVCNADRLMSAVWFLIQSSLIESYEFATITWKIRPSFFVSYERALQWLSPNSNKHPNIVHPGASGRQ